MDFCKSFNIGPIHIYVSTVRMKRRGKRDDIYRNNKKKLMRIKHQMWRMSGGCCMECGRKFDEDELEIHHIIPVSKRPELILSVSNMHLVCPACHNKLHGRPMGGVKVTQDEENQ